MTIWIKLIGFALFAVASVDDIRKREIPLYLLVAGIATAGSGVVAFLVGREGSLTELALSFLPGLLLLAVAFLTREKLGYGDGLMVLMMGPVFGWMQLSAGLCLAFFLSAGVSVVLLCMRRVDRNSRLPFIPFLMTAMGVVNIAF